MARKIYSAEQLNSYVQKIEAKGFIPQTQKYALQSSFPNIIIDNALPRAGQLRTYAETRAFLKQVSPKTFEKYTEEQYKAEIKQINQQLGKRATYLGELRVQRERLNNIVFDMNEIQGTYFNPRDFSIDELYKAYKRAMQRSKEDGKSDYFYEYLSEELESYE